MSYLIPEKPYGPRIDVDGFVSAMKRIKDTYEAENAQCPVCGFYCLGKGGEGCIDKPSLIDAVKDQPK